MGLNPVLTGTPFATVDLREVVGAFVTQSQSRADRDTVRDGRRKRTAPPSRTCLNPVLTGQGGVL